MGVPWKGAWEKRGGGVFWGGTDTPIHIMDLPSNRQEPKEIVIETLLL